MQITSEIVEPRQSRLTIVVPQSRVERALDKTARQLSREMKIPGYRPGKAPLRLVMARLGEDTVREEALEQLAKEVVHEAVASEGLEPSAPANVEITEQEPLTLTVLLPLQPTVDLGDYREELRLERPEAEPVTDEDVDAYVEQLRADLAYLEPVERPAEAEDVVLLKLVGVLEDRVVFDDDALTVRLDEAGARSAHVPASVTDELIGLSVGEEHQFSVVYPEDWRQPDLQDKTVEFTAEIAQISQVMLPEADDELAQQVSDAETLDELEDRIRSNLEARAKMEARDTHAERVLAAFTDMADIAYPPALLETETARMFADLQRRVERQGMRWERWLELQNADQDTVWNQLEPEAEQRLRRRLALSEFVRQDEIRLEMSEVEPEVARLKESARAAEAKVDEDELLDRAINRLMAEKSMARLLAIADGRPDAEAPAEQPQPSDTQADIADERDESLHEPAT